MSGYKKFSDSWRTAAEPGASQTLAVLVTLAGVQGQSEKSDAPGTKNEEPSWGAAKAAIPAKVTTPLRYQRTFAHLQLQPPAYVPEDRWRQCVEDGREFLTTWGSQAEALGWDSRNLFGLHQPPERPHPSYRRLSRYDATGLCWLLQGRPVVALTADTAAIENATGSITVYRKHNKPALAPRRSSAKLKDLRRTRVARKSH
ncbi:MAG TPA: hypothetical protein VKE98_03680 [Gemmataceae bacterium]|nr:hypothetical protein [Gemmataceae bacterium]